MLGDLFTYWSRRKREIRKPLRPVDPPVLATLRKRSGSKDPRLTPIGQVLPSCQDKLNLLLTPSEVRGHTLVLGRTGSGKTTWAIGHAEALARQGFSIACLSPHPDLDRGFLSIAARLELPCVHIDFSGRGQVVTPFSFFKVDGVRPDEVAHLAQTLFASSFGGGGAAGAIRSALGPLFYLMASFPDELDLLDADRLVADTAFARGCLQRLSHPLPWVSSFFASCAGKGGAKNAHWALARIHALLNYRGVQWSLCGRPPVDLRDAIRRPCVIVVSVPAAQLGDAAGLLAGLFLEHLRLVLMQRPVPCSEPPLAVFIDELGSLVTGAERLGAFLAESRKFGATLVGLTQSLHQLEARKNLLDAFLTNTSTFVLGRLGRADAKRFSELPPPVGLQTSYEYPELWVDGVEARWRDPESRCEEPPDMTRLLADAPARTFCVHTPLEGTPTTFRMKAFSIKIPPVDWDRLQREGSLPAQKVERKLRKRLQRHAQALAQSSAQPPRNRGTTPRAAPPPAQRTSPTTTPQSPSVPRVRPAKKSFPRPRGPFRGV